MPIAQSKTFMPVIGNAVARRNKPKKKPKIKKDSAHNYAKNWATAAAAAAEQELLSGWPALELGPCLMGLPRLIGRLRLGPSHCRYFGKPDKTMAAVPRLVPISLALFIASVIVCNYNHELCPSSAAAGGSAMARMEPRPDLIWSGNFLPITQQMTSINIFSLIFFFGLFLLCAVYDFCCFYEATDDDRPIVR